MNEWMNEHKHPLLHSIATHTQTVFCQTGSLSQMPVLFPDQQGQAHYALTEGSKQINVDKQKLSKNIATMIS